MDAIRRILVATDFSDRSERAIRRAAQLASAFSAELTLVHVVEGGQPEHLVRAVENLASDELAAAARSVAESYAIACSAKVVRGDAFDEIVRLARELSADLVVMGTHRKGLLRDVLVGTTLERVVRQQAAPVLVVNAGNPGGYRSVLAAIDFSACSGYALETARALGLLSGTRVTIVHVSDPSGSVERGAPAGDVDAQIAAGALEASHALTEFLGTLDLRDVEYSTRVRPEDGPPGMGIADVAAERDADLVVVGTQGQNRTVRMLLGSVTDYLLKALDADILVVPCAGAAPPA